MNEYEPNPAWVDAPFHVDWALDYAGSGQFKWRIINRQPKQTMTPRLLFFRGTDLISAAIRWQTRSHYSHVAVSIERTPFDAHVVIEAYPGKGVRERRVEAAELIKYDVHEYEFRQPTMTAFESSILLNFLRMQVGKPYDYLGVARFLTRSKDSDLVNRKWFCSELAAAAFKHAHHPLLNVEESWKISPALLAMSPLLRRIA